VRERLRCLVADDHPALVAAVSSVLEQHDFEVVGPVADGRRALALVQSSAPDVALIDYRMPYLAGCELIAALREAAPDMPIAVYTAHADEQVAAEMLERGADAVVLKEAPLADVVRALEAIRSGRRYVDPALASAFGSAGGRGRVVLTDREREVLELLAEGQSHEEIGRRLSISSETVRTHARKASERLGASTRTQAVATALRLRLIS
jgi:DNA-binding NarL/FixJ family response regulator